MSCPRTQPVFDLTEDFLTNVAFTFPSLTLWHYAVGDCVTTLVGYRAMYENALKSALIASRII